ncbi:PAS domain S-box protein [Geosporobacter ferrireducens]|uniref:Circadian input-output histidine kinase CikA n=1 Tax=Geosporobacter ferrireducens TaxID=1424294 RepID=A0A1D8GEG3_9FIRM|nr:PAS domain S-box protein [Geosporobacter ferrireducens]AOT69309.1 hypothetical protein Gferi_06830 [Geosporobacter ferrireducens]
MSESAYPEMQNEALDTLKNLFNIIEDYIFIVDTSGEIIDANHAALRRLGYSIEELQGTSILMLYPPEKREEAFAATKGMMEGQIYKSMLPLFSKNGEYIFVETRVFRGRWHGKNVAFGVCKDISTSRQQQYFFRTMIDVIPDFLFFKNREDLYLGCNKAFSEKIIGLSEEEIIGKSTQDIIKDRAVAQHCIANDMEVFKSGEIRINEETIRLTDGSIVDVETVKTPFYDECGKIAGIIGIARDITQRMCMEKQLRESEERYSAIVNSAPQIVLIHKGGKIKFVSEAGLKALGYEAAEVIGHHVGEFVSGESKERVLSALHKRLQGDTVGDYEIEFVRKTGEIMNLIVRTTSITYENESAALSVLIDITERKRSEEELNRKEKILSAVAMSVKEFLSNCNYLDAVKKSFELLGTATQVDRVYLFQNSYDEDGNGYVSQRIQWNSDKKGLRIDNSKFNKIPFNDVISFMEPLSRGEAYYGRVRELKKDRVREMLEARNVLSIAVIPIFIKEYFWGVVGFHSCDVERNWSEAESSALKAFVNSLERAIERSMINEELEKSRRAAETASILKGQFLANMSHEIRTPMNGIIGFVDLLLRTDLSSEQSEYLRQIKSDSDVLLRIINDILDYSKIEADKLELEEILFDMHVLVKESVALFTPKAYEKDIRMNLLISKDVPKGLYGDPGRLKQVLNNLIGNALKFTEKGEIVIKVLLLENKENHVKVQFTVNDTGIGMSEQVRSKLFTMFTQADASMTRKYGGTGLGLAISKRIIELMGGTIRAESVLGKGSTFYVEVDFEKSKMHEELIIEDKLLMSKEFLESLHNTFISKTNCFEKCMEETREVPVDEEAWNKRYNVLLVEDALANRKLAAAMLNQLGYRVELAENGQQAVWMCSVKKYDIILMDCQMPIMDGYKAASRIRTGEGMNRDTIIIAMTAHAMEGDRDKCIAAGMDDYISKPITMFQLDNIIKKRLNNSFLVMSDT